MKKEYLDNVTLTLRADSCWLQSCTLKLLLGVQPQKERHSYFKFDIVDRIIAEVTVESVKFCISQRYVAVKKVRNSASFKTNLFYQTQFKRFWRIT